MAIVEDEMLNDSEEENEIEVVVEEDDADQDSEDSEDDDDEEEEALEKKVADLEEKIKEDPYNYDEHIELIQALWTLSELERWRAAFERLQNLSLLHAEHWLLRLKTEIRLVHTNQSREHIVTLFKQATLDCYSIPILTEWCTWCLSFDNTEEARAQINEILDIAGADPLSGKVFWDAKLELEKSKLNTMSEEDSEYKTQRGRVLTCLEEMVTRPLLQGEEAWHQLQEFVGDDQDYIEMMKKQHEKAVEFLEAITPYEDKLLTNDNQEDKCKVYQDYIETVKAFSENESYYECDCNGILRVLYDRVTHECLACPSAQALLPTYARHSRHASRHIYSRVLDSCTRRSPRTALFWTLKMQYAEREEKTFEEVKNIFETALSKGMQAYKEAESLWLSYLEYIRRCTNFESETEVERLRRTFRLAWDSLAGAWGEEANDCEVPLYWARLEYKRMHDPKQGKQIFEEIFNYGDNKTMSKYWEPFIQLELSRNPPLSEHKSRDLFRRALKFCADYPPAVARLWTDYERDHGTLVALEECTEASEKKIKEWRENYQALKEKMTGKKLKGKTLDKKFDKKKRKDEETSNKGKRKSDDSFEDGSTVKRKKETNSDSGVMKRPHSDELNEVTDKKRQRTESAESSGSQTNREDCTLFVSNLEFKVDENKLKDKLSEYGEIITMRVKAGVKAFGGSICYCQYKSQSSVEEALKHDRTPLDGRPMFFSRYSSKKSKPSFKYATSTEKNKLFLKNLPFSHCTKEKLEEIFDKYGKLKDIRIVTFKDGKPKGLAYIEYEDEQAAATALEKTNGLLVNGRNIDVAISAPPPRSEPTMSTLGQPKRDGSGGMRRTQVSFIPSVLQKASTSKAANGSSSNGAEKRPLSNTDFRNLLLNKK